MTSIKNFFSLTLLLLGLFACEKKDEIQPGLKDNQIAALQASPEMINLNNKLLIIESEIWRDFMPPGDGSGSPLMVRVVLSERNQRLIDKSISLEKVYLINQDKLWSKSFDSTDSSSPYQLSGTARSGPKWGPDIKVDLICEFTFQGETYRLIAKDQEIYATY